MSWPENITRKDLRVSYYKGSGPGGQHRNKRETACRIFHTPTGAASCAENHKSQGQNRKAAFRKLADILVPRMLRELREADDGEASFISTVRVRTYHQKSGVRDTRLPGIRYDYKAILNGDLDDLLERLLGTVTNVE